MRPRIGVSIQARFGSTRLPGKVVMDLAGAPLLLRVWRRLTACGSVDELAVSTSEASEPVVALCRDNGIDFRVGPEEDLLSRHLRVARDFDLDALVRVTCDNPLTDPQGIDELVEAYATSDYEVVHNKHRAGYPFGTGAELVARSVLEELDRRLEPDGERAVVFGTLLGGALGFKTLRVDAPSGLSRPDYFLTVDHEEDVLLFTAIYEHFDGRDDMSLAEVIDFLDRNPEVAAVNRHLHRGFAS